MLNLVGLQYASQYHFTFELSIAKKYNGFVDQKNLLLIMQMVLW